MTYKVAITSSNENVSANDINEKDYTNEISSYIAKRLNNLGIESFFVDEDDNLTIDEKINAIQSNYGTGDDIIVISNRLRSEGDTGVEIMYPLRNNSNLASEIATDLESIGANVTKYFQLRNEDDTALDDDYLIRNTGSNQTIVIDYGNVSDEDEASFLKENQEVLAEAVVKAIAAYTNISYLPENLDGYYIVSSGDTLWAIANKYNTTVDELKTLNNLTSNTLQIGQILKLPTDSESEENENTYTVKSGDTLYSIANKYNTTVDELKTLNNLTSNTLQIGQILKLPTDSESEENENTYTVKSGDTLYSIASKYNTTVDEIKSINNLSSNLLSIGQILILPTSDTINQIVYTVQKGDSLWKIANTYDTTVDEIKSANNLTSNTLQIGQTLIIPTTSKYKLYTVQKGDTLWTIANTYNTTVDDIKKLNNITSDILQIGQQLTIPA